MSIKWTNDHYVERFLEEARQRRWSHVAIRRVLPDLRSGKRIWLIYNNKLGVVTPAELKMALSKPRKVKRNA